MYLSKERIEPAILKPSKTEKKYKEPVIFLILLIACYFVFFSKLAFPSVHLWDESRIAVNALEMTLSDNWIVTYFHGQPDLWNTKPPFLIWCVALSMKVFGYNEFALRFPSAVSALATTILIFYFGKNYFKDLKVGLIGSLVLITSVGYIGEHIARTGDYDAMLVLWITIYSLSLFSYLESAEKRKNVYLVIATIALILAVLTKSIAGFLALPGILIYAAARKKLGKLLFSRQTAILAAIFLSVVLGYYFLREYYNPGYINAVIGNELTGRYLTTIENHSQPYKFYLMNFRERFALWLYILPISLIIGYLSRDRKIKQFSLFGLSYLGCFVLIISLAKTKIFWYDAPFYPIASLIVGLGISEILNSLTQHNRVHNSWYRPLFSGIVILFIFLKPYYAVAYQKIHATNGEIIWEQTADIYRYRDYLRQIAKKEPKLTKFSIIHDGYASHPDEGYAAHLLFYVESYNLNGYSIELKSSQDRLVDNEIVATCLAKIATKLESSYTLKPLHTDLPCYTYRK